MDPRACPAREGRQPCLRWIIPWPPTLQRSRRTHTVGAGTTARYPDAADGEAILAGAARLGSVSEGHPRSARSPPPRGYLGVAISCVSADSLSPGVSLDDGWPLANRAATAAP